MLSYQHAYHAGNHADLLKHLVLREVLAHLRKKPAPVTYVDSHAGEGAYDLTGPLAQRLREFEGGVGIALRALPKAPAPVRAFLDEVLALPGNEGGALRALLGSPGWAQRWLREQDRLFLFEQHPQAFPALRAALGEDPRVIVQRADGFAGALSILRAPTKRALWLLDPAYERREEDQEVIRRVRQVSRQLPGAVLAIWYPVVERARTEALLEGVLEATVAPLLKLELSIAPDHPGRGMTGSGMLVANPPYTLADTFVEVLPWLMDTLAPEHGAGMLRWLRLAP